MTTGGVTLALWLALAQVAGPGAGDLHLDNVKRLYATASYEEALAEITALDGRGDPNQLDHYRALCQIGLGLNTEADQTLERLVLRAPEFRLAPGDASPAFLHRFMQIRRRVLPTAANRLYLKARNSYDARDFGAAAAQLEDLIALLQAEAGERDASLTNVQQMAQGFLRLTRAELAATNRVVYNSLDYDVTPPVELARPMPAWNPPPGYGWRWFRGAVEVVVDEQGRVESVRLVESVADFYDASLLEATKSWRFQPASRLGDPVKYRKRIEITMRSE